jgi:hypothetical protein
MIDVFGRWRRRVREDAAGLLEIRDAALMAALTELNAGAGDDAALDAYNSTVHLIRAEYLRGISVVNERY